MKIRNFVGIALLLILSLIYTWYEANRPRPVDWSETYSPKDKIPYGTYITYRSLPELFPDSKIRTSRLSIAEEVGGIHLPGHTFLSVRTIGSMPLN